MTDKRKTKAPGALPTIMASDVTRIPPGLLRELGVRLVLLDVDNTIAPYGVDAVSPEIARWVRSLKDAGIEPFILSNNRGHRPELFAGALDIGWVGRLSKPFARSAVRAILKERGLEPREAAVIGDQVFTDGLCARLNGLYSAVVRPAELKSPLLAARYCLEFPFRIAYKVRKQKNG